MRYGKVDREYGMQLATCPPDEDGPVLMVNFMKYREQAAYDAVDAPAISGREADDRYAPVDVLAEIGARPVFFGDVVDQQGRPVPEWDRVGIVLYPTRRAFIEMQSRPDFQDKHVHKEAGMQFTIVMAAVPVGPDTGTDASTPRRAERVRFTALPATSGAAPKPGESCVPVEGTIIGDERRFRELRVSWMSADEAATARFTIAPAEGLDVLVRPTIDRLGETLASWPHG